MADDAQHSQADNSTIPPLPANHPYHTLKDCDVVMKGGITSGVVYPGAVHELAKTYRLHSIGGTSAGAIAAAAAAAAELGRWHKEDHASFDLLAKLPTCLGQVDCETKQSRLAALFQPQARTKALFDTAFAFLGDDGGRLWRVLQAALLSFPLAGAIGILPAVLLLLFSFDPRNAGLGLLEIVLVALFGLVGLLVALGVAFGWQAFTRLKDNYFGLCTGMPAPHQGSFPALTMWLADYLDELARIGNPRTPLTFGDLRWGHGKRAPKGDEDAKPNLKVDPAITLRMITTNLTLGRPYSLPLETRIFYFDPEEWRNFFPPRIVDWLVEHSNHCDGDKPGTKVQTLDGRMLVQLPDADEMPVVVATRMSLSFPILLSAVPLYLVDYSREMNGGVGNDITEDEDSEIEIPNRTLFTAERCWFSDGGIASNFPIHFFDSPLPRWPTFAINLSLPHPDHPLDGVAEEEKIWMPKNNRSGILPTWSRFDESATFAPLFQFLGTILSTARSWMDQTQMMSPGYRDRIVHIQLDQKEGGLNLNMPKTTIDNLALRGVAAGASLVDHFTKPSSAENIISWDNHRWIRYRSSMTMIEELLEKIEIGYSFEPEGERTYQKLIARDANSAPTSYPWVANDSKKVQKKKGVGAGGQENDELRDNEQRQLAIECTTSLIELAHHWQELREQHKRRLGDKTPRPVPEMQGRARI